MNPFDMLCEYRIRPMGVERRPLLTWRVRGTDGARPEGYRLLVAADEADLSEERAYWDSGAILSDTCACTYDGPPLASCTAYVWTVKALCGGVWTAYAPPALFETGLLSRKDWDGVFIGMPNDSRAVALFRHHEPLAARVVRARVYLASDGYAELWINGKKAGENLLEPANADHAKRVYYNTYDVTPLLTAGDNAVGVMLGRGWSPHARFLLQGLAWLENGECVRFCSRFSDWVFSISPVLSATIYSGEVYNANYECPEWNLPGCAFEKNVPKRRWTLFCDSLPRRPEDNPEQFAEFGRACFDVMELPAPGGVLCSQMMEPIREMRQFKPVSMTRLPDGKYVFDFGQNFAGVIRIRLRGEPYTEVKIQYSEILNKDNTLNMEYLRVSDPSYPLPMQCDTYVLKGDGEEVYQPRFTYHGFRYVSVEGGVRDLREEDVVGVAMYTAVRQTGQFVCGNVLINRIQDNILWTERSNLYSIPTDCCQRSERQGWLNDLTARAEASVYNFDLNLFYEKFLRDIRDTQDPVSGAIADTAPFRRGNMPADPVSSSYLILPDLLYTHYGNRRPMEEQYEGLRMWTDFLGRNSRDGIVSFSLYGDWASPIEHCCHNGIYSPISNITPGNFVSSGYYYYNLGLMERFATLLGRREDAAAFAARRKSVAAAINRVFRDEETGDYAGGSQGSNVFALYLGLVPAQDTARVAARVDEDVRRRGYHLTTGNLMTKYLLEVLTAYGYLETAYRLVVQTTYPSWGYMLSKDATTIWERWEYETGYGMNSHNHPMYGSISAWFYKYLAGISAEAPGFAAVKIQPYLPEELPFVRCSLETCAGRIGSSWSRETDGVELLVEIPGDVTADLYLPIRPDAAGVDRDGVPLWRRDTGAVPDDALRFIGGEPGYLHFAGRGGNYRFWIY